MLADMLEGREKISVELQRIIDARTEPWGVNVISVEVRDVLIPPGSRTRCRCRRRPSASARRASSSATRSARSREKFGEAAKTYADDPVALHLRAMNMLYEGLKQNATIVLVPSSALDTMQLGGIADAAARSMGVSKNEAQKEARSEAPPVRHHS